jgi:hypothetical protein
MEYKVYLNIFNIIITNIETVVYLIPYESQYRTRKSS